MKKLLSIFSAIFLFTAAGTTTIACGEFLEFRGFDKDDENTDPNNPDPNNPDPEEPKLKKIEDHILNTYLGELEWGHGQLLVKGEKTGPGIIDKILELNQSEDLRLDEFYLNSYWNKDGKLVHELKVREDSEIYEQGAIEITWDGDQKIKLDSFILYYANGNTENIGLEFNRSEINKNEYQEITRIKLKNWYPGLNVYDQIDISGADNQIHKIMITARENPNKIYEGWIAIVYKPLGESDSDDDEDKNEDKELQK